MIGPHGHVEPRPDGAKARCGGPQLCTQCQAEAHAYEIVGYRIRNDQAEHIYRPDEIVIVRRRDVASQGIPGKLRKIAQQLEDSDNLLPPVVLAAIMSLRMIAADLPE